MKTVNIERKALAAAIISAPKSDVRYYLNGLLLEVNYDGFVIVVGTDGHRMTVCLSATTGDTNEPFNIIVPHEVISNVLKVNKSSHVTLVIDGDSHTLGGLPFTPVDGKYPDWRRTIPNDDAQAPLVLSFNPSYMLDAHKSTAAYDEKTLAKLLNSSLFSQTYYGDKVIASSPGNDCFTVVCGRRSESPFTRPAFTKATIS